MGKSIENLKTVTRVGVDLAKNVLQVHAVDAKGDVVAARALRRGAVLEFFGKLPPCVVAMETCSSAHHWGRALIALGHEVKLIPAAHVKPYVRRGKNDAADAAAICEASMRPGQRFVAVRSIENQAELMRHRARELLSGQRTALINALRGHLAEIGIVAAQGARNAYGLKRMLIDGADEHGEIVVPECVLAALRPLSEQIDALDAAIEAIDEEIEAAVKADEKARRLMTIPGVGPLTASAIVCDGSRHERVRQRARVRRLSRPDATPAFERRQATARAHHQNGRPLFAQAAGGGGLRRDPPSRGPQRRAQALGQGDAGTQNRSPTGSS